MTLCELYAEIKSWQPVLGAVLGFGALTWGALYNYRLGRKRDDILRDKDSASVALGLYSEINLISTELAKMANALGNWYIKYGVQGRDPPSHFQDSFVLPDAALYKSLASKVGMLPSNILMSITRFYGYYGEAVAHFPKVLEKDDSSASYGIEWVLGPAVAAIEDVQPALREIECLGHIKEQAKVPELQKARDALQLEKEMRPDFHD